MAASAALEGRPRNPVAPVPASGEDATDPPVGHLVQALGIGFRVVDVWKLHRRSVLAPADAFIAVVNQNLVHRSVSNVRLLCQTVPSNGMALAHALWVETHAPAAAPDPVVSLHQMGKVVPSVRTERPRHIGADWCHPSMVTSSNSAWSESELAFTFKSTGTSTISDDIYNDTKIYDSAGQGFDGSFEDTASGPGFPTGEINVAPGGTATGWEMFEAPGSATGLTVTFTPAEGSANQAATTWNLGG